MSDVSKVIFAFQDLSLRKQQKILLQSLGKAGGILCRAVRSNMAKSNPSFGIPNPKYSDTILDAVRLSYDKNDLKTKVHIMGIRDSSSGTYRARFYENGTKDRIIQRKNGESTNLKKLPSYHFFRDAKAEKEQEVYSSLERSLMEFINQAIK